MVAFYGKVRFRIFTYHFLHTLFSTIKPNSGYLNLKAIPSTPFIQSSQGKDDMGAGEGGAFQIQEYDTLTTTHQNIASITYEGGNIVRVAGTLSEHTETAAVLHYTFKFVQVAEKQLRFVVEIGGVENIKKMGTFEHVLITFASRKEEQFYGFGEQFSFCDAKGEKIPILVRCVEIYDSDELWLQCNRNDFL